MQKIKMCVSVVCLLALLAPLVGAQEVTSVDDGYWSTRPLKTKTAAKAGDRVEIRAATGLHGSLKIEVADQEIAQAVYMKRAKTRSKQRATDYIDVIAVSFARIPDGIRLELRAPNPAPWRNNEQGMVDVELVLPPDCLLEIDATYFDINVRGPFAGLTNTSSLGQLQAEGVQGAVQLTTANQRIKVADIEGEVVLNTSNAMIFAENIDAGQGEATFRNENGDIKIFGLAGRANVATNFGRIDIAEFRAGDQKSYIRGNSGPIRVEVIDTGRCQLLIANRYEDIELMVPATIDAVVALAVEDGSKIETQGVPFRSEMVQPNRLNLIAGQGQGLVTASIRGDGNIYLRGSEHEQ